MIATISDNHLVEIGQVTLYPMGFHLENYRKVLQIENLFNSAKISVLRTLIGTASGVLCTTYLAYFFTKENMWARRSDSWLSKQSYAWTAEYFLDLHRPKPDFCL